MLRPSRIFASVVLSLAATSAPSDAALPSEDRPDAKTAQRALRGYLRPYIGWGWPVLSAPENSLSRYRFATGLSTGINLSRYSLGIDFNYFNGTRFFGGLNHDPTVQGIGRTNAFRLAVDAGYDLGWNWMTLRPHLEIGVEWRRLRIGDSFLRYSRSTFWAPSLLVLTPLRRDGLFAIGIDVRWNMILIDGTLYNQFSSLLAFESKF